MTTSTETKGLSRGAKIALSLVALGALCVPCTGTLAAIGIPSFMRYVRESKAAEARTNLSALRGLAEHAEGRIALGPTPPLETLGSEARAFGDEPAWRALGFSPPTPVRYSYVVLRDPAAGTVHVEAVGDLDQDGLRSRFFIDGRFDPAAGPAGIVSWGETIELDPLE
jgi:type II secretory pathway pseudopilin PulG